MEQSGYGLTRCELAQLWTCLAKVSLVQSDKNHSVFVALFPCGLATMLLVRRIAWFQCCSAVDVACPGSYEVAWPVMLRDWW